MVTMETKKAMVQNMIAKYPLAVENALLALYARQTDDEKSNRDTHWANGRGFNQKDADFLSSLAIHINKNQRKPGDRLTAAQRSWARKLLPKYWRQLIEVADAKNPSWAEPAALGTGDAKAILHAAQDNGF